MSDDRHDRVSRRAYELWEQEGGEHGRHEDHWHRADAEVEQDMVVTAPDGTTLTVPADPVDDADPVEDTPAKPTRKRAAAKAETPAPSPAPTADKSPAKPRKPKAK